MEKDNTMIVAMIIGGMIATTVVKYLQFRSNQKRIDEERKLILEAERIAKEAMQQEHEKRMEEIRIKGEEELKKMKEKDDKEFEDFKRRCANIFRRHGFTPPSSFTES
jgi:uncharacterized membrane protein YgaE (UPF0421/DUF939 family)